MTDDLLIAAEVLEKAAAYIEAIEAEKQVAAQTERAKIASELKTKFTEITGESLSDEQAAKLASSEPVVQALVEKLAGSLRAPDSMGGPGEATDASAPTTTKEAAEAAEARFGAWLNS
jgi:hypothetical protein